MNKKFQRLIGLFLSFLTVLSCIKLCTPVSAYIDDDDMKTYYIYSFKRFENGFINEMYEGINTFFDCPRPTGEEENIGFPNAMMRYGNGAEPKFRVGEEFLYARKCAKIFPKLIKSLCGHRFDDQYSFNLFRIIFLFSVVCITYLVGYVGLTQNMLYVLNKFRDHSRIVDELMQNNEQRWNFVLGHIENYNADNLLSTAEYLCACGF